MSKILGVVALLAPLPARVKEWAYFEFFIVLVSALAAPHFQAQPNLFVLNREIVTAAAATNPLMAEVLEMLYQYEVDYVFDSSKFNHAFGFTPTSYEAGIRQAADYFKSVS